MYLGFTRKPDESYHRRLRPLLLYFCYVFRWLINSFVCFKIKKFQRLKIMTVSAAVNVCPVVCISGIVIKDGMSGDSVKHGTRLPFFWSLFVKSEPIWLRPEKLKSEA